MPTITSEDVIPSLIPNNVMVKVLVDGVHKNYQITAAEGYVLHDKRGSRAVCDEDGNETGKTEPRFRVGSASVPASYDFDNVVADTYNGINGIIQVQKVGEFEFYAIPETEVPECDKW